MVQNNMSTDQDWIQQGPNAETVSMEEGTFGLSQLVAGDLARGCSERLARIPPLQLVKISQDRRAVES